LTFCIVFYYAICILVIMRHTLYDFEVLKLYCKETKQR